MLNIKIVHKNQLIYLGNLGFVPAVGEIIEIDAPPPSEKGKMYRTNIGLSDNPNNEVSRYGRFTVIGKRYRIYRDRTLIVITVELKDED